MAHSPFGDEEEVLILTTRQSLPRWLRWLLQALAVLTGIALVVLAFIGWRYYSVQRQVKRDLAAFIAHEEEVRALGGINAAPDLIVSNAPANWRFRYLSSIRARKDRPLPDLTLEKVDYDGQSARAYLRVNGVRQFRKYQLQEGEWRRAPFQATGWGEKQVLPLPVGVEIVYWDEDEAFAQSLANDIPRLLTVLQALGLSPTAASHRLIIIPAEFGDLVRPARRITGMVVNSPHVDLIPQAPGNLTSEEELRLALAREWLTDARDAAPQLSTLPGAPRVYAAMDEVLAWAWAVGGVSDAAVADWAEQLKGEWVSPVTGVPPDLITKLQPNAGELAARLMMTYILRQEGVDALIALSEALSTAQSWDEAYGQAVGKTALQVEEAARAMARAPKQSLPPWPDAQQLPPPTTLTYLAFLPTSRTILARTPEGQAITLSFPDERYPILADGSPLDFACIAAGSELHVTGQWVDVGLRMEGSRILLERAMLPPLAQIPPIPSDAWAVVVQSPDSGPYQTMTLHSDGEFRPLISAWPLIGDADSPPLLVWQRDVRCSRSWVVAYRPDRGIVDAWLTPQGADYLSEAISLNDQGDHLLLYLYSGEGASATAYETQPRHVIASIPPERQRTLLAALPAARRFQVQLSTSGEAQNEVKMVDRATGKERVIYRARPRESIEFPVTVVGDASDELHFAVMGDGRMSILSVRPDAPDDIEPLFETKEMYMMPILARCPDGSYLYGAIRPGEQADETIGMLRIHRTHGEDVLLREDTNTQFWPFYCARSP